jgi:3-mercaptopyruvate sulfurtransferase SseA
MMAMGFKETEREWAERSKRFVKAELKRADVTYEELAAKLRELGLEETKVSVSSKLSRGGFGAVFFIATMKAIGRENVNLADV